MGWSFISSRADFNFEQVRGGGAQSVVRPFGWVHRNLRGTQNLLGLGGTMGGKPFPDRGGGGQHNISRFFLLSPHLFLSRNPKGISPDASFLCFPGQQRHFSFLFFPPLYHTTHDASSASGATKQPSLPFPALFSSLIFLRPVASKQVWISPKCANI